MKLSDSQLSSLSNLPGKVSRIKGKRLIVVGDCGLDEYVFGRVRRISPEAPVPIVEVIDTTASDLRLGLATNVAQNITSLGGECHLVSVVGRDQACENLRRLLSKANISPEYLVLDESRPTTRKLRVMSGQHHIVRIDYENQRFLSPNIENQLIERIQDLLPSSDGVVIQDYAKGVLSERCIQAVVSAAISKSKPVFVDPHRNTPVHYYRGVTLMTPNYDEALALSGLKFDDLRLASESLKEVGEVLSRAINSQELVITRGKEGMSIFQGLQYTHIPTFARQVFDVTGAGDTVIATLALAYTTGFSLEESCLLANQAAGVVVGKIGCVPCNLTELRESMAQHLSELN